MSSNLDDEIKGLWSDAMDILDEETLNGDEADIICPNCKKTFHIKTLKNAVCPACGRKIIASS